MIGRNERDELSPSIDAVKKLAQVLYTTLAYLHGEGKEEKILKNTAMLKRRNDFKALSGKGK